MLDGLLGRGFSSKCKSEIKATKSRIEVVRRRAEAKQRFLKDDLVKLLVNGLDINAYGRTEEYLVGLNLLASYDFIEKTCEYITGQLSCMQKIRECPEECREAVGSLIFAAARFSDFPELRDLRDLFKERYGNSLDCYVHPKFLEKLSSKTPERERRIQVLEDIASECSIKWDSRGFKQRMTTPSASPQKVQPKKHGSNHVTANKYNLHTSSDGSQKVDSFDFLHKKKPELVNSSERTENGRRDALPRREENILKTNRRDGLVNQKPELVNGGERTENGRRDAFSSREENTLKTNRRDGLINQNLELVDGDSVRDNKESGVTRREEAVVQPVRTREGRTSVGDKKDILFHGNLEITAGKYRSNNGDDDLCPKAEKSGRLSHRKKMENGEMPSNGLDKISKGELWVGLFSEKSDVAPSLGEIPGTSRDVSTPHDHVRESPMRKMQEKEAERLHSYQSSVLPPPYVKSKDSFLTPPYTKPRDANHRNGKVSTHANCEYDVPPMEASSQDRVVANNHPDKIHREMDQSKHELRGPGPTGADDFGADDTVHNQGNMFPLPKPRSVRRKHHRSSSSQNEFGRPEESGSTRRISSRRRDHSKKGLQILFDEDHHEKDNKEKMIDKLLLKYSKKPSGFDKEKQRINSHATRSRIPDAGPPSHDRSNDEQPENLAPPTRSVSLPHGQTVLADSVKVYARANSFQPDNQAHHVHPKLPDYDDLAARIAALRGGQ